MERWEWGKACPISLPAGDKGGRAVWGSFVSLCSAIKRKQLKQPNRTSLGCLVTTVIYNAISTPGSRLLTSSPLSRSLPFSSLFRPPNARSIAQSTLSAAERGCRRRHRRRCELRSSPISARALLAKGVWRRRIGGHEETQGTANDGDPTHVEPIGRPPKQSMHDSDRPSLYFLWMKTALWTRLIPDSSPTSSDRARISSGDRIRVAEPRRRNSGGPPGKGGGWVCR